jgi:predicted  nucleic acid-binding Zn-ribbon protein
VPLFPSSRLTRAIVAVLAAGLLGVIPSLVRAEDVENPREERERVREQAADVAAQLDGLQADAADVSDALDALAANVQAKRAQLQDARRASRSALADAQTARAEEHRLEQEIIYLRAALAEVAVNAYVRPPLSDEVAVFDTEDIADSTLRAALLDARTGQQADVIDQMRATEDDLSAQRAAAEDAAQEAELLRGQIEGRYEALRAAQDQQRALAQQIEERVNAAAGEAAALAEQDAELSDQIAEEAAEFAAFIQGINLGPVGQPYQSGPVEVVDVGGIVVNVVIADQVRAMLSAAAADGVTLTGGGYRSSQQQIDLRIAHCGSSSYAIYQAPASSCSPPTAIPGTSMHEQGLAIDFDNCYYGSTVYNWLSANAATYGLYNLPSESWHWSTTGT